MPGLTRDQQRKLKTENMANNAEERRKNWLVSQIENEKFEQCKYIVFLFASVDKMVLWFV